MHPSASPLPPPPPPPPPPLPQRPISPDPGLAGDKLSPCPMGAPCLLRSDARHCAELSHRAQSQCPMGKFCKYLAPPCDAKSFEHLAQFSHHTPEKVCPLAAGGSCFDKTESHRSEYSHRDKKECPYGQGLWACARNGGRKRRKRGGGRREGKTGRRGMPLSEDRPRIRLIGSIDCARANIVGRWKYSLSDATV